MIKTYKTENTSDGGRSENQITRSGSMRRSTAAVIVMVIALAATATWAMWPATTTRDEKAFHDQVIAAWNTGDADAIRRLYSTDADVWLSNFPGPIAQGVEEIVAETEFAAQNGTVITRLAGPYVSENGELIWALIHVSTSVDISGADGVTIFVMNDGRIKEHWTIWEE